MSMKQHISLLRTVGGISLLCLNMFFMTACSSTPRVDVTHKKVDIGRSILKSAKSQLGVRYRFGGRSPATGFDCSGLTWYSHRAHGINIPRESAAQFKGGKYISKKHLKPGDLVFFETYKPGPSHVGVYSGNGMFIHSPTSNKTVEIKSLSNKYFKHQYLGARRYW